MFVLIALELLFPCLFHLRTMYRTQLVLLTSLLPCTLHVRTANTLLYDPSHWRRAKGRGRKSGEGCETGWVSGQYVLLCGELCIIHFDAA